MITFFDQHGKVIEKEFVPLEGQYLHCVYDGHYMLKEIAETPQVIRQALMQDKGVLLSVAQDILRARQVVMTACGTSRYAALVGRYLFSQIAGVFCEVVMASEFEYFADSVDRDTVIIALSQSGETADVMQGVKKAHGATIVSLTNVTSSSLARMSDYVLPLNCGPEIGVAATKSFTAQLVVLYLLAFAVANRLEGGVEAIRTLSHFKKGTGDIEQVAQRMKYQDHFYFIGRGVNFPMASEGALKVKEISYIHAEGMPAGELKHGSLALVEQGTPVVVICPRDGTYNDSISNATECKARGAYVIGVSDSSNPVFDVWIEIPQVEEVFYPLVMAAPLQLLAYYLAVARSCDPDKPRNLDKSVTVK